MIFHGLAAVFFQTSLKRCTLSQEMAAAMVGASEKQAAPVRQEMQNWISFPNFLLAEHWDLLQSNARQLQKLETVWNHLIRMGLRHPSERTHATLAALVSYVGPNALDPLAAPDVARQTALLSTVKACFKTQLVRLRNLGGLLSGGYIVELPAAVQDLPLALRNEMFSNGAVVPPVDMNPIWQMAHAWAVRSTHRARTMGQQNLSGVAGSADAASIAAQAALSTVTALVPHVAAAHGSAETLPGLQIFGAGRRSSSSAAPRQDFAAALDRASALAADATTNSASAPLALVDVSSSPAAESGVPATVSVPALREQRPDAAVQAAHAAQTEAVVAAPAAQTEAVVAAPAAQTEAAVAEQDLEMNLASLADLHYERPLPSFAGSPGKTGTKMRKPAAAAAVMRRPAAASHSAPSKVKRPASALKPVVRSKAAAAKKRPAVGASTRKTVTRSQAKRLRPDGCGKCRYQCGCTPSCWRKDGITLVED